MKLDERKTALSTTTGAAIVIIAIVVIGLVVYAGMRPGSSSTTVLSGLVGRSSTSVLNSTSSCTSAAVPPYSCSSTVSSISTNSSMSCVPPELGCSSNSSSSSSSSTGANVTIPNGAGASAAGAPGYSPANITVIIGVNNTVTWTNKDAVSHTVASSSIPAGAANFTSAIIAPGGTYSYTFTVPGTYIYYCTLHAWMKGTVTVKAAPSPASPK